MLSTGDFLVIDFDRFWNSAPFLGDVVSTVSGCSVPFSCFLLFTTGFSLGFGGVEVDLVEVIEVGRPTLENREVAVVGRERAGREVDVALLGFVAVVCGLERLARTAEVTLLVAADLTGKRSI